MLRRDFLRQTTAGTTLAVTGGSWVGLRKSLAATLVSADSLSVRFERASRKLQAAVDAKQVSAATLHVRQRDEQQSAAFGGASDEQAMFLLGSISKPICMIALMRFFDQGRFRLEDRADRYLPAFRGEGREQVTIRHLLTHVSGLPDQLPENNELRRQHAFLGQFADVAQKTPLSFAPGTKYQYSSMAILLASRIAERLACQEIRSLVNETVFAPLGMTRSAQGLGKFGREDFIPVQTERAAPESGGGDPQAKNWDWNSEYWRALGAPWGGTHASAPDLGKLFAEFLRPTGAVLKPSTVRLMIENHNPSGLPPRGLGWNVGSSAGNPGASPETFGHTGSTGTLAWADPRTQTICVVLTSLPARAVTPHPRDEANAALG